MSDNLCRSEWRLFQLDSEFEYSNIERSELEGILSRFSSWIQAGVRGVGSPDGALDLFCVQEFDGSPDRSLPSIGLDSEALCPSYAVNFIPMETFVNRWSCRKGYGIDPDDLIKRLTERDERLRVSKELAEDGMKLGVGRDGHKHFWLGAQGIADPQQMCSLPEAELRRILDRTGLPWQVRPSKLLRVLAAVIPLLRVTDTNGTIKGVGRDQLRVPTMFHAGWAYFEPSRDASVKWGRTIDLRAHSSATGVPEALCGEIDWHESFVLCYAGELNDNYSPYGEGDFEQLLRNSWRGRKAE